MEKNEPAVAKQLISPGWRQKYSRLLLLFFDWIIIIVNFASFELESRINLDI